MLKIQRLTHQRHLCCFGYLTNVFPDLAVLWFLFDLNLHNPSWSRLRNTGTQLWLEGEASAIRIKQQTNTSFQLSEGYPLVNKHWPWQIGFGRLVSINNWLFSGSMFIYQMVKGNRKLHIMCQSLIELDDGKILTGNPDQFDGKNPWVSG